jgi:hypothetical protein
MATGRHVSLWPAASISKRSAPPSSALTWFLSAIVHYHFLCAIAQLPCLLLLNATPVTCLPFAVVVRCFKEYVRSRHTALKLDDAFEVRGVRREPGLATQLFRPLFSYRTKQNVRRRVQQLNSLKPAQHGFTRVILHYSTMHLMRLANHQIPKQGVCFSARDIPAIAYHQPKAGWP